MRKVRMTLAVMLIFSIMQLLLGCGDQMQAPPISSELWETMPAVSYGTMESEKLTVQPWNSGRCEATSYNMFAETEKGFYQMYTSWLYYADKSDLTKWVVLCNQPDCNHRGMFCNGQIYSPAFIIRDQQIFRTGDSSKYSHLIHEKGAGTVFVKSNLDGNNPQVVYVPEGSVLTGGGGISNYYMDGQWIFFVSSVDLAGITHTKGFAVTEEGYSDFFETEGDMPNLTLMGAKNMFSIYGDKYFYCSVLDSSGTKIHRIRDGELQERDISGLPVKGSYLSGDILRCFRQNDGYYDIDLTTGEEVRLCDAQLENSYCTMLLPNCIIESTLLYPDSVDTRVGGMTHSMAVFDGESWHTVALPQELEKASYNTFINVRCVTSDSILFSRSERVKVLIDGEEQTYMDLVLYRIPLGQEDWKLEYIGTVQTPRET